MRNFKNIVASITYYRKHNIVLFVFFSISLFIFTTLELLSKIQHEKFSQIINSWSTLNNYLPGNSERAFKTIRASDDALQQHYERLLLIAVSVISILLIVLTGTLLYKRRQDIKSLLSLGLSKASIIVQLIIEAIFPIVLSFIALICLSLFFQNTIKNQAVSLNNNLFIGELREQTKERGSANFSAEGPTVTKTDTNQVLLPFKSKSFYLLETSDNSLNYPTIRRAVAQTFLKFAGLALLLISLVTTFSVLALNYRMNY